MTQPAPVSNRRRVLSLEEYASGVRSGDLAILGRAITLVESARPDHQELARALVTELMPLTGRAHRVGITGVPGVGKSTFIEALGKHLTNAGKRIAVLAVDPSSNVTGGSILGDKTRMVELAADPRAFIRPSPSGCTLGGVAAKTRETMLLCEAAGFDAVLVETVGVGQSETVVANMTDFFLALMLPGAGDELQGIKRGLLELVDMIAVNKADGDNLLRAKSAAREYANVVHFTRPRHGDWVPPVQTCSARQKAGIPEIWEEIEKRYLDWSGNGRLAALRHQQSLSWMWTLVDEQLRQALEQDALTQSLRPSLEASVRDGRLSATLAAERLVQGFLQQRR